MWGGCRSVVARVSAKVVNKLKFAVRTKHKVVSPLPWAEFKTRRFTGLWTPKNGEAHFPILTAKSESDRRRRGGGGSVAGHPGLC